MVAKQLIGHTLYLWRQSVNAICRLHACRAKFGKFGITIRA